MAPHPKHALPIGHCIGGYEIVRVIGQGGFGIVYEARNPDTGDRVAIKEFYPSAIATRQGSTIVLHSDREMDLYKSVLERFRSTAALQFNFDHPNILKVRNYIRGENTGYMITDYVDGEPMRNFLGPHGGHIPSEQMFADVFRPITRAIGYIHTKGHLHRDISPDNIMIDGFGKPVLIDFGALKLDLRASNQYSSIIFVREDFSPPEQQDRSPDRPEGFYTDVFALAGTMYHGLAGMPPPRVTSRVFHADRDPYVPAATASKIPCPPEVFDAIDCSLRLPPHERPQTVAEFEDMLGWGTAKRVPPPRRDIPPVSTSRPQPERVERAETAAVEVPWPSAGAAEPPEPEVSLPPPPPMVPKPPRRSWFGYFAIVVVAAIVIAVFALQWDKASDEPLSPRQGTSSPQQSSSSSDAPRDAAALRTRGLAFADGGDFDRAIAEYTEAIRVDPTLVAAYTSRGLAYINKHEYDRAIRDYDQAIRLSPNDADSFNDRGIAYARRNEPDRALADYNEAIRLNPNYAQAYFNRGTIYTGKGDFDRALKEYEQSIKLDARYAPAHYNQGLALRSKGQTDAAIQAFSQAIQINANYADAYNNRGIAYNDKREYDRAIADYDQAIRLNPIFILAYYNRAIAQKTRNQRDRAIADFQKVLTLGPNEQTRRLTETGLRELGVTP